ncbi:MAG: ATP-binding protein [Lachnospiraceae bacterium]|nr:ATP-binding protein [Lachnospiraceae bacterium]
MLLQFKFANYRSFADETVFNMTAAPIREHKNSLLCQNGVKVLPVAALYGANASGKSSFFRAFDSMCSLVKGSCEEELIKAYANAFTFSAIYAKKPIEYEVSLAFNEYEYRYGFEHNSEKILCEYLYKKKLSVNNTIEKIIFERVGKKVICNANAAIKKEVGYCASMCPGHSLMLTDLGRRGKISEIKKIFDWFGLIAVSIFGGYVGEVPANIFQGDTPYLTALRKKSISLISEIDKGIAAIIPVKNESDENYVLKSIHKYDGKEIEVPFMIESDGTKKLLTLAYSAFGALDCGGYLFIDELDTKLHPLLLRKIVHMFKNKDINKHGAQLVFSAHNIINLDSSDLRRDEIWFVEKNNHKSTIFSLYDYEDDGGGDIRSDLDYGKHYLLGRFGAIPFKDS